MIACGPDREVRERNADHDDAEQCQKMPEMPVA